MIRIKNLTKTFGDFTAVDNVSMNIEKGMIYGFLGHNGAGKTTTMRAIMGLISYDSGEIEKDGNGIGFIPEAPVFYEFMTLEGYLKYLGDLKGGVSKERIDEVIETAGLSNFKKKRISRFSRGMKQRAAIAAGILDNPSVLLFDEPTSALDPQGRRDVLDLVKSLRSEDRTILISSHILNDLEDVSDKIGIIKEGKMLVEEDISELRKMHQRSILHITVDGEYDMSVLQGFEVISSEDGDVKVMMTDPDTKNKLLSALLGIGADIVSFESLRPSLEDIYFEVVK